MSRATLVIMAAGIGSRFGGGIKQLAPVGPNGEIIMDYSIYDAIEAGFDKVVFVIRKDLEKDFKEVIGNRIEKQVEIFSTLKNIIKKAEELSCELLIISGDLFSHQPVTSELESMNRLFLSIPGTEIVMVTGRGDMIRKNSPILSFNWAPNVHFEPKDGPVKYRLPRLGAVVYGISVFEHSGKGTKELSEFIAEDRDEELLIRIAAIWEPSSEKAEEAFSGLDISYAALGGKESNE